MRFKTFRTILIGGLAVAGLGGLLAASTCCKKDDSGAQTTKVDAGKQPATTPKTTPTTTAPATETAVPADALALRPMDQKILDLLDKPASGDKLKDAAAGQPWKVNLYREGSATKWNRAKIDLNRNERWDEKWSVETDNGQEVIKRQVAPADDEKYTEEYRLQAGKWVPKKK